MSVPHPRRAHGLQGRHPASAAHSRARKLEQREERSNAREVGHSHTSHRLTWFTTCQGLSFLAFVMLADTFALVAALMVCGGIALCVPAIIATCVSGRVRKPIHLILAIFWAIVGAMHVGMLLS